MLSHLQEAEELNLKLLEEISEISVNHNLNKHNLKNK
jgi:hypothetical protein